MKFSLCIEPIFEDLPFYERFQVAKDLGCDAVEFWDPWASNEDITPAGLGKASADAGIPIAACCLNKAWTYRMTFPWETVKKNVELSMGYAKEMGVKTMIGLSGEVMCKTDSEKILLLENLKRAGEIAERNGVTIVLEALNSLYDHKGYYLDSSYVGFEIMKAVDCPNIKLLYDCYHMPAVMSCTWAKPTILSSSRLLTMPATISTSASSTGPLTTTRSPSPTF